VIAEWADRARDAEKKLKALNTSPQPAQQEPVTKKKHEPKIDLGKYAGTYGGYITPEPSEGYLQKAYRLANELRSHLSIAPPQRTWVGLTDEEIKAFDTWHDNREEEVGWCNPSEIVAYIEAKLKEKNT
jgi:hypothetical protein